MTDLNAGQNALVETDHNVVRSELERVLNDKRFSGAPQMSAFLKYIVNETLEGHADRIKAFSVGVDALGKPDTFDAQTDPSVRVLALRLRKTLAALYEEADECLAVIELKVGTYVPNFYKAPSATEVIEDTHKEAPCLSDTPPVGITVHRERGVAATEVAVAHVEDMKPIDQSSPGSNASVVMQPLESSDVVETVQPKTAQGALSVAHSDERRNDKPERRRGAGTSIAASLSNQWLVRWVVMGGAILLAVAWQLNSTIADAGSGPSTLLGTTSLDASQASVPALVAKGVQDKPVIVIDDSTMGIDFERKVTLILSSRFLQSGSVEVVRATQEQPLIASAAGYYQLVINGYQVENQTHVDAQLVRLSDGQMLYANSMLLDRTDSAFTSGEMRQIDAMADGITDTAGPVYLDFCTQVANSKAGEQRGCTVS